MVDLWSVKPKNTNLCFLYGFKGNERRQLLIQRATRCLPTIIIIKSSFRVAPADAYVILMKITFLFVLDLPSLPGFKNHKKSYKSCDFSHKFDFQKSQKSPQTNFCRNCLLNIK
jgi:hypothetical protein